jgi:hypothetical protein
MLENYLKCNNNCIQPLVYIIPAIMSIIILLSTTFGATIKGDSAVANYLLFNSIIYILIAIIMFKILEWFCTKGEYTIAWLLVGIPYFVMAITGFYVGYKGVNQNKMY